MIRDVDSVQDAECRKTVQVLIRRFLMLIPGRRTVRYPLFCFLGG